MLIFTISLASAAMTPDDVISITPVQTQFMNISLINGSYVQNCSEATMESSQQLMLVTSGRANAFNLTSWDAYHFNEANYTTNQFWVDQTNKLLILQHPTQGCLAAIPFRYSLGAFVVYIANPPSPINKYLYFSFEPFIYNNRTVADSYATISEGYYNGSFYFPSQWSVPWLFNSSPSGTYTFVTDLDGSNTTKMLFSDIDGERLVREQFISNYTCTQFWSMDGGSGGSTVFKTYKNCTPDVPPAPRSLVFGMENLHSFMTYEGKCGQRPRFYTDRFVLASSVATAVGGENGSMYDFNITPAAGPSYATNAVYFGINNKTLVIPYKDGNATCMLRISNWTLSTVKYTPPNNNFNPKHLIFYPQKFKVPNSTVTADGGIYFVEAGMQMYNYVNWLVPWVKKGSTQNYDFLTNLDKNNNTKELLYTLRTKTYFVRPIFTGATGTNLTYLNKSYITFGIPMNST
jgi:hypothetical protein